MIRKFKQKNIKLNFKEEKCKKIITEIRLLRKMMKKINKKIFR